MAFEKKLDRAYASGMPLHPDRVRESLVHVIHQADTFKKTISQFDILKTIFLADREHLNKYGRPVTFDNYVAMQDGPVANLSYNILKLDRSALSIAGIKEPLWRMEFDDHKKYCYFDAVRTASDEYLSESDMSLLTEKLLQVKEWGWKRIWDHVHGDAAYIDAWGKRAGAGQYPMDYTLFLDNPDDDHIRDLKFFARHL